jgi:hypothetical protein
MRLNTFERLHCLTERSIWRSLSLQISYMYIVLVICLFLPACVTSQANQRISDFSTAASMVAMNTQKAFDIVNQNYYRAKVASLIVDYDVKGFNPAQVMTLFDEKDIDARKKVLEGMELYGSKLTELMGDKQLTEFDAETKGAGDQLITLKDSESLKKFARGVKGETINLSVVNIPGSSLDIASVPLAEFGKLSGGVTDQQVNLLTAGIDALGRFLIEQKREREVKQIVKDMNAPVKAICALLISDIGRLPDKDGKDGKGLRDLSWREFEKLLKAQDSFILQNKDKFDPRTKAEEIAKLPALVDERQKTDNTLRSAQDALTKLAETHDQLVTAFDKDSPNLDKLIGQLISEGKRISDYYNSLSKK